MVEQQRISGLIELVRRRYPHWQNFADSQFLEDEISFKRATIARARELINEGELTDLLNEERFDEFIERLEMLGSDNNLLWRRVPARGDLGILHQSDLDRPTFCLAVFDLLYGQGETPIRLGRYVNYVRSQGLPNKWTFPTYFLFLCHPEGELFVKPATIKWLLQFFGEEAAWSNGPSVGAYDRIRSLALELRDSLRKCDPQDMVDIQSLIWVAFDSVETGDYAFSPQAFKLLERLEKTPTKAFYRAHRDEFQKRVEQPLQDVLYEVIENLPGFILERMQTRTRLFSNMLKNDGAQGGVWTHYWGALYPKNGNRADGAQLLLSIDSEKVEFGFRLGQRGQSSWKRFVHNCDANREILGRLLDGLSGQNSAGHAIDGFDCETLGEADRVTVALPRSIALQLTSFQLVQSITDTFLRVFPLVLLASENDPLPFIRDYLDEVPVSRAEYSLAQCAEDTGVDESTLLHWTRAIERKGQAILYGPPGTGKTFLAEHLARHLTAGGDGFRELVQFHPAYAYEDFIQGIRPRNRPDGSLEYPLVPGRFLEFCRRAEECRGTCVLIIDEINRADLSRVFGELMFLMEYRDQAIPLAGGTTFRVPENVRLLGTMNTANRSIALIDHALRRRFAFLALHPDFDVLRRYHRKTGATGITVGGLVSVLENLNRRIGDPHYAVGITYFLTPDLKSQVEDIWRFEIEPYLEEYFFDRPEQVDAFRWEKVGDTILG